MVEYLQEAKPFRPIVVVLGYLKHSEVVFFLFEQQLFISLLLACFMTKYFVFLAPCILPKHKEKQKTSIKIADYKFYSYANLV